MPPFVPRKREQTPSTTNGTPSKRSKADNGTPVKVPTRNGSASAKQQHKPTQINHSDDSSLSSLTCEGSSESPDPPSKHRKSPLKRQPDGVPKKPETLSDQSGLNDSSGTDSDDDHAWDQFAAAHARSGASGTQQGEEPPENMELTLDQAPQYSRVSLAKGDGKKKGPSKVEKMIRMGAHQMHVQCLLAHNLRRNAWTCDKEVQTNLSSTLSAGCKDEVERFKNACGDKLESNKLGNGSSPKSIGKAGAGKPKASKPLKTHKNQRDWGYKADHLEGGVPDLSHGDPTLRLLKVLTAFWRKKFEVTAPGLRKQGWKDVERLNGEIKSYRDDPFDADSHGERVASLEDYRNMARKCEGSRDVGAQLFTALLRGIGLQARMVASLQPVGFGFSKTEEADPPRKKVQDHSRVADKMTTNGTASRTQSNKASSKAQPKRDARSSGKRDQPVDISDDDDSVLSDPPSTSDSDSGSDSVVDITPIRSIKSSKRYDRDLPFPTNWTEVFSPITQNWIPVDPIVLSLVSNNPEAHHVFEPRGAKADKAKQVIAYVVAFSADGTAKDVTVRYLKNHVWPGKTKGIRVLPEKIPIYNRAGKVKRYEHYDWFKHVMAMFAPQDSSHRTTADDIEHTRDLQPVTPQKPNTDTAGDQKETLQGYKNSADFVLARHLRREEALLPDATPVKTFSIGKGDKAKSEPVYRRSDLRICKTAESWHKEGRAVREGERPLKHVPMRAVTLTRKREVEETERTTGEKMMQPLHSRDQTEWIIPPPIQDGVIPKNAFGNIDVYVPTMVPEGAVHIPLRATARVCKKLNIDFAEACTGFEFGNKIAVPVLTGVVVAKENEDMVIDAWEVEEEARVKRERKKKEQLALGTWKKFMTGLRVIERFRRDYGEGADADRIVEKAVKIEKGKMEKKGKKKKKKKKSAEKGKSREDPIDVDDVDVVDGGGFLAAGHHIDEIPEDGDDDAHVDDDGGGGGGFILEHEDGEVAASAAPTKGTNPPNDRAPVSLSSLLQKDSTQPKKHQHQTNGNPDQDTDGEMVDLDEPSSPPPPQNSNTKPAPKSTPKRKPAKSDKKTTPRSATLKQDKRGIPKVQDVERTASSSRGRRSTAARVSLREPSGDEESDDET